MDHQTFTAAWGKAATKKSLAPEELAENLGAAYVQKKAITDAWDGLRKMALALRRKKFASKNWEISVVPNGESMRWDSEKIEAYCEKNSIDPDKFKSAQDTGARVLVKRLTT